MDFDRMDMKAVILLFLIGSLTVFSGCVMIEPTQDAAPKFESSTELYNKALGYYQKGKYAPARELFSQYVADYPNSELFRVALYYSGHCYQMLGDTKEALVIYNRIVAIYGDDDFWGEQAFKRIKQIKEE